MARSPRHPRKTRYPTRVRDAWLAAWPRAWSPLPSLPASSEVAESLPLSHPLPLPSSAKSLLRSCSLWGRASLTGRGLDNTCCPIFSRQQRRRQLQQALLDAEQERAGNFPRRARHLLLPVLAYLGAFPGWLGARCCSDTSASVDSASRYPSMEYSITGTPLPPPRPEGSTTAQKFAVQARHHHNGGNFRFLRDDERRVPPQRASVPGIRGK